MPHPHHHLKLCSIQYELSTPCMVPFHWDSIDALSLGSALAISGDVELIAVARAKDATKEFTRKATGAVYVFSVHSLYETFGSSSKNRYHCCRYLTVNDPATNSGMPLRYHNTRISWLLGITVGENDTDTALRMIQLWVIIIQHLRALASVPTRCVLDGR